MSEKLRHQLLAGRGISGIYAVCSAHPWVIEAAVLQALQDGTPLLVEATSNQVNQYGGYTGMRPADFRDFVQKIARDARLPLERLYLGGDHLGPNPWSAMKASESMKRACEMVEQYVQAGFTKLHLDASMPCAGDPEQLTDEVVAERAARLCAAAERAVAERDGEQPIYIIGTEVPPPGGALHDIAHLEVTRESAVERTLAVHRAAFLAAGLHDAWKRIVGIVVQPGVEFDHDRVFGFDPMAARKLQGFLQNHAEIVFEAHSTDYQQSGAFRELVRDGFAILKVGPALTFALREAVFALAAIETELVAATRQSRLREIIEHTMLDEPKYWQRYYTGDEHEKRLLRAFSYSDRIRYYWPANPIQEGLTKLLANLDGVRIPATLLSQYLPAAGAALDTRNKVTAKSLVIAHIRLELARYSQACYGNAMIHA